MSPSLHLYFHVRTIKKHAVATFQKGSEFVIFLTASSTVEGQIATQCTRCRNLTSSSNLTFWTSVTSETVCLAIYFVFSRNTQQEDLVRNVNVSTKSSCGTTKCWLNVFDMTLLQSFYLPHIKLAFGSDALIIKTCVINSSHKHPRLPLYFLSIAKLTQLLLKKTRFYRF